MTEQSYDPAEIVARYADGPSQLEAAIAGLDEADLDLGPPDGGWTIRQIVHHVVDGDDLWKTCILAALGDSPGIFSLPWYWDLPQDRWAEIWLYASRPVEPSLARFRVNREHIVDLVKRIPGALECTILVRWPNGEEQQVPAGGILMMQADHVPGHVDDIQKIRQAHSL